MDYGVLIVELWAIGILILTPIAELVLHWQKLGLLHLTNPPDLSDLSLLPLEDLRARKPNAYKIVTQWVVVSTRNFIKRDIV